MVHAVVVHVVIIAVAFVAVAFVVVAVVGGVLLLMLLPHTNNDHVYA